MPSDQAVARSLPRGPAIIFSLLVGVGIGAFVWGLSEDPARAHRVFLYNWLLWAALAQGALVLSAAFRLTNARWQGPLQRLVDSMGAFVPFSLLLFLLIYLGRQQIFAWTDHGWAVAELHQKALWFSDPLVFYRDVAVLVWLTVVSVFYLYLSVRPLLAAARGNPSAWQGVVRCWTAGWRGEMRERELAERRLRKLAALLVLSYVLGYSLLAIDLVMSLAPHWVSTMFPAYYAWGGFLSAVSLATLIMLCMRNSDALAGQVTRSRRHDMGKMIFAFSIFWMYLFWSQYLVIWYGNIPEETSFVAARLGSEFLQHTWYFEGFWSRLGEPYARITLLAWILVWLIPFVVLLGQRPKQLPAILGSVALLSLVGFWLERYILVTPSLVTPEAVLGGAAVSAVQPLELGISAGFVGLFFLCFLAFARVFPGVLPPQAR